MQGGVPTHAQVGGGEVENGQRRGRRVDPLEDEIGIELRDEDVQSGGGDGGERVIGRVAIAEKVRRLRAVRTGDVGIARFVHGDAHAGIFGHALDGGARF